MDTITLEQALKLFELPRHLGDTPEGEPVQANIGRFGPYIRYGQRNFVSLKDIDPHEITLEQALERIEAHKQMLRERIIQRFEDEDIEVLKGRYGPFVTDGSRNASVPKDREPSELTLEECRKLLAEAPARGRRGKKKAGTKKTGSKKSAKKKASKKKASKKKSSKKKATRNKATKKKTVKA